MSVRSIALVAVAFVLGGLALFGFQRFQPSSPADAAAAGGCDAAATANWVPDKSGAYRAEAFANGARCEQAVVTIAVRAPDGGVLLAEAASASDVMTFVDVKAQPAMQVALNDWLAQRHMFKTSGDLPAWPLGAQAPQAGEFPFYPEADVDRETYENIRAEKAPVFCYVQGRESMACYALSRGAFCTANPTAPACVVPELRRVGVQTFPG